MRPLLTDGALEKPIESFTSHLTSKHESDLCFTRTPDQGSICDAQGLRNQSQKGTCMCDGVVWVLQALSGRLFDAAVFFYTHIVHMS
jgi:hypothetical protein